MGCGPSTSSPKQAKRSQISQAGNVSIVPAGGVSCAGTPGTATDSVRSPQSLVFSIQASPGRTPLSNHKASPLHHLQNSSFHHSWKSERTMSSHFMKSAKTPRAAYGDLLDLGTKRNFPDHMLAFCSSQRTVVKNHAVDNHLSSLDEQNISMTRPRTSAVGSIQNCIGWEDNGDESDSQVRIPECSYFGLTVDAIEEYLYSLPREKQTIPLSQLLLSMSQREFTSTICWAANRHRNCRGTVNKNDCGVRPANLFVVHQSQQSVYELVIGLRSFVDSVKSKYTYFFWVPFLCLHSGNFCVVNSGPLPGAARATCFRHPCKCADQRGIAHASAAFGHDQQEHDIIPEQHTTSLSNELQNAWKSFSLQNAGGAIKQFEGYESILYQQDIHSLCANFGAFLGSQSADAYQEILSTSFPEGNLMLDPFISNLMVDIGRVICVVSGDVSHFTASMEDNKYLRSQCCFAYSQGITVEFAFQDESIGRMLSATDEGCHTLEEVISSLLGPPDSRTFTFNAREAALLQKQQRLDRPSPAMEREYTFALDSFEYLWFQCKVSEWLAISSAEYLQSTRLPLENLALCPSGISTVYALRDCGRLLASRNLSVRIFEARLLYSHNSQGERLEDDPSFDFGLARAAAAAGACFRDSMDYTKAIKYMTLSREKFRSHLLNCQSKSRRLLRREAQQLVATTEYLSSEACLGDLQHLLGDVTGSLQTLSHCLQGRQQHLGEKHRLTLRTLVDLSAVYHDTGDLDSAFEFVAEAAQGFAAIGDKLDPDYLSAMMTKAIILKDRKEYKLAQPIFQEIIPLFEKLWGEHDVRTLSCYTHACHNLLSLGNGDALVDFLSGVVNNLSQAPFYQAMLSQEWKEIIKFANNVLAAQQSSSQRSLTFKPGFKAVEKLGAAIAGYESLYIQKEGLHLCCSAD